MKMTNNLLTLRKPADYYSLPLLSNSGIAAFEAKLHELPAFSVSQQTLRKGQLVHLATYQPEDFQKCPEVLGYANSEAQIQANWKLLGEVRNLSDIAKATPIIKTYLGHKKAQFEQDIFCLIQLPDGRKVPVKIKPDAMIPGHINDLKTTACSTREQFLEKFIEYKYFRQAWLYMTGTGCKNFTFLGVSKTKLGTTFLVDMKDHKKEVKEAGEVVLDLIRCYLERHPDYIRKSMLLFNP